MAEVGIHNALMLLLAVGMMTVGALGVTGRIIDTTPVLIGCFLAAIALAFSIGRRSRDLL